MTNITGVRQIELWRRDDLQHPRLDEVAKKFPLRWSTTAFRMW
ncbi:hypothetical protein ACVXG8_06480 [Escherichia coli]